MFRSDRAGPGRSSSLRSRLGRRPRRARGGREGGRKGEREGGSGGGGRCAHEIPVEL